MSRSIWNIAKHEAVAERAMVAAEHPLAAEAGLEVLRRGGNAVDAAATMAFAMGVLGPSGSGIGGGGLMVVHLAGPRRTLVVDFAMDAPRLATADAFRILDRPSANRFRWRAVEDDANAIGYRAASVPGQVRGLALALERFGTLSLGQALAPAIRFAAEGFDVGPDLALDVVSGMDLLGRFPASAAVFLPAGRPPIPYSGFDAGERLVQADLARTLRLIAAEGADAFYAGPIARAIDAAMREHDGLLRLEDLAAYRPTVYEGGQVVEYRGLQLVGVPGACGSITTQQALVLLEAFDLASSGPDSLRTLHLEAEAYRRAFADRYRYVGDPKQVPVPWQGLLSRAYNRRRAAEIDPQRATPSVEPGDPWAFAPAGAAAAASGAGVPGSGGHSTTHLCAVDAERNVVSLTQTIVDGFGCGVVIPETGVLLNNAMLWLDPEPGRPNSIAPGKRGLNNMSPLVALRDGVPFLAVGSPGGARIVNAISQVVVNVVDHGLGIQDAIAAPRLDASGPELLLDSRLPDEVLVGLERLGHQQRVVEETFHAAHFSTPLGILIDPRDGRLHGGVHPFKDSVAIGD